MTSSAPLWVPLLVGLLGLLGTTSGIIAAVITQRRSDSREATAWNRQTERLAEERAREDALRTFEHRRVAYTEFYASLRTFSDAIEDRISSSAGPEEEAELLRAGLESLRTMNIAFLYAPPRTAALIVKAHRSYWDLSRSEPDSPSRQALADQALESEWELTQVYRKEFGVGEIAASD